VTILLRQGAILLEREQVAFAFHKFKNKMIVIREGQEFCCPGIEVLTSVAMKSTVSWAITPCSSDVARRINSVFKTEE
jgi:hypothetical protein